VTAPAWVIRDWLAAFGGLSSEAGRGTPVNFEIVNALRNLDEQTPEYLRHEVWAHGDTTTPRIAAHILRTGLDRHMRSSRTLREILRLIPREGQSAG
jgi:hypothetical protein